jgi:hypothetical protein
VALRTLGFWHALAACRAEVCRDSSRAFTGSGYDANPWAVMHKNLLLMGLHTHANGRKDVHRVAQLLLCLVRREGGYAVRTSGYR